MPCLNPSYFSAYISDSGRRWLRDSINLCTTVLHCPLYWSTVNPPEAWPVFPALKSLLTVSFNLNLGRTSPSVLYRHLLGISYDYIISIRPPTPPTFFSWSLQYVALLLLSRRLHFSSAYTWTHSHRKVAPKSQTPAGSQSRLVDGCNRRHLTHESASQSAVSRTGLAKNC